ncbi:MAG: hypothetical protein AAGK05_17545 [Pseudomonadota bacterium]
MFPSFSQMSLALSENDQERDITTIESSDAFQWRFLTVIYKAPNDVKFFRNGEEWPMLHKRMPTNPKIIPSSHIRMFKGYEGVRTYGTLAFVVVLQRGISQRKGKEMIMGDYSHMLCVAVFSFSEQLFIFYFLFFISNFYSCSRCRVFVFDAKRHALKHKRLNAAFSLD